MDQKETVMSCRYRDYTNPRPYKKKLSTADAGNSLHDPQASFTLARTILPPSTDKYSEAAPEKRLAAESCSESHRRLCLLQPTLTTLILALQRRQAASTLKHAGVFGAFRPRHRGDAGNQA